jgi:hypothetical protein
VTPPSITITTSRNKNTRRLPHTETNVKRVNVKWRVREEVGCTDLVRVQGFLPQPFEPIGGAMVTRPRGFRWGNRCLSRPDWVILGSASAGRAACACIFCSYHRALDWAFLLPSLCEKYCLILVDDEFVRQCAMHTVEKPAQWRPLRIHTRNDCTRDCIAFHVRCRHESNDRIDRHTIHV